MSDRLQNPDLDRLVRELNLLSGSGGAEGSEEVESSAGREPPARRERSVEASPPPLPALGSDTTGVGFGEDEPLERLLVALVRRGGSDLLLVPGLAPTVRMDGALHPLPEADALDGEELSGLFRPHLSAWARDQLERHGAADFSLRLAADPPGTTAGGKGEADGARGWRFRVNLHRQRGELAAAIRALPRRVPSLEELRLPGALSELVRSSRGLVLLCGPTGAGKSSTLAALVGEINRTSRRHLILIEDPVEYEHRSDRSLVEQIEVGRDTRSFADALRAALRQDPDVILVGEMRDLETVRIALTAAETGHLVLSTLHTHDSAQAIHRIVDVFSPADREQIRHQLALSLQAIVTQQLIPRIDGRGRVPAIELLLATHPVRHHIRTDQLQKLYNEITLAKRQGMISLEESLAALVRRGVIDEEEARLRSIRPDEIDSLLRGA